MRRQITEVLVGGFLVATCGAAAAHHSFAMFDQQNPVEVVGTVKEFRFTSPHVYIFLEIKAKDGTSEIWNLEGGSPSLLVRDGWTSKSLQPGDEIQMRIDPLRSGAPGGAFQAIRIKFKDGRPIVPPK
jgi:Family of unknown function (DUF6152)